MTNLTIANLVDVHSKVETTTDNPNNVVVAGVVYKYTFDKSKLVEHRKEIIDLLAELPDNFRKQSGGGWSFLNVCEDKHGRLWGEHIHVDLLMSMGIAIGVVEYLMPREMWPILPGSVPYYVVDLDAEGKL